MIKMGIDPDNKVKYIKLTKHVIIATVLITISLTLIEIPKYYFGSSVEVTDGQVSDMTIGKIEDADCQGRETINIDGRRYVVTDINVKLSALKDNQAFIKVIQTSNELGECQLQNCSILRAFSECQGAFKGYFAEIKFFRDSDGMIFPVTTTYSEYIQMKSNDGGVSVNGR